MKISQSVQNGSSLLAQIAIPGLLVIGVRMMTLSDGPASASASITSRQDASQNSPPIPEFVLDPSAQRQIDEAAKVAGVPIQRDPFASTAFRVEDPSIGALLINPPAPASDRAVTAPQLRLTSIAGGRETIAVINDRVARVGDTVSEGWTIAEIDASSETVVIEHTTGARETYWISR